METDQPIREMTGNKVIWYWGAVEKERCMVKDRTISMMAQRFNSLVWERLSGESDGRYGLYSDLAKKEAENKALREEIARLKLELEEATCQSRGAHRNILMCSAVDALLRQAKSLSTIVSEREGNTEPSAGR